MRINPFALHYFLWFAALTPIYGYISVYAEHYANATSSQYGFLNMILTFTSIGVKLYFCSLADRLRAHRTLLVIFIILSLIGYGSFAILPSVITIQPKELGLHHLSWTLICIMTTISTLAMGVVGCLSDSFAMNSSRKNETSYGLIRVWGTLGWGISSIILAFINQSTELPLLVPGLLLMIALIIVDVLVAACWPDKEEFQLRSSVYSAEYDSAIRQNDTKSTILDKTASDANYGATNPARVVMIDPRVSQKRDITSIGVQWVLFKEVARRRTSLFRYMLLFTITGALASLQWSYFFLFLDKIYHEDFGFISSLSMLGQSMMGELPFFLLSKIVIQKLGRSNTLSVSILSIGVRYLLYEYLLTKSSMYFVLLTESLQGPSFGLFYVVMTEVALDYSDCEDAIKTAVERGIIENNASEIQKLRIALRTTMQSLMSACYEGLGLGLGSVVGGLIIEHYDFSSLWLWSASLAIFLGLSNILIDSSTTSKSIVISRDPIMSVN